MDHSLSGDGSQSRIGGQVDVEGAGCGICHHTGNALLLQVDLVWSDCAAGRWHSRVGVNFNALTLVDGGCVEGEGGAGQAAAETVAGFYAELAGVEPGDVHAESWRRF